MYLQENTVFDLDLGIKITSNIAKHPLHQVTKAHAMIEVVTSNYLGRDVFTSKYSTLGNISSYLAIKVT